MAKLKEDMMELIPGFLIESKVMRDLVEKIKLVAQRNVTVLIKGESGVGKELVARSIHELSPRADKPFIPVNCAGIPEGLAESEFFGHEKGAFTSAYRRAAGKFELADGGTIFLDEVSELSLLLQPKLLRVLESREFYTVGGVKRHRTDARVIVATNQDLFGLVKANKFRADLFYRLDVIPLSIPPLRERREEIRVLAEYFLMRQNDENPDWPQKKFSAAALDLLEAQNWIGNVRELENIVTRLSVLVSSTEIGEEEIWNVLPVTYAGQKGFPEATGGLSERVVPIRIAMRSSKLSTSETKSAYREYLRQQLSDHKWNVAATARTLGARRPTLYNWIRKYGIEKP